MKKTITTLIFPHPRAIISAILQNNSPPLLSEFQIFNSLPFFIFNQFKKPTYMKNVFLSFAFILFAICGATSANAQNIHFIGSPTITDMGTQLQFCGKLAGLGNNQSVVVTLSTKATITTTCTNAGGNIAPGQTKTETITHSGTFQSDANGTVTFCLESPVPTPGPCPNGNWTGTVSEVSFTGSKILVNGKTVK
jgi:hypothetical protein